MGRIITDILRQTIHVRNIYIPTRTPEIKHPWPCFLVNLPHPSVLCPGGFEAPATHDRQQLLGTPKCGLKGPDETEISRIGHIDIRVVTQNMFKHGTSRCVSISDSSGVSKPPCTSTPKNGFSMLFIDARPDTKMHQSPAPLWTCHNSWSILAKPAAPAVGSHRDPTSNDFRPVVPQRLHPSS